MTTQILSIRQWHFIPLVICGVGCIALEVSSLQRGQWFPPLAYIAVLGIVAGATTTDVTRLRIPNSITYPACLLAGAFGLTVTTLGEWFSTSAANALGVIGIQECLVGAAACFCAMLVVWSLAGRGGGDVKLATALGAFVGMRAGLQIILVAHVLAALVALAWLCLQWGLLRTSGLLLRQIGQFFLPMSMCTPRPEEQELMRRPIPMAAFFAIASIITMCGVRLS